MAFSRFKVFFTLLEYFSIVSIAIAVSTASPPFSDFHFATPKVLAPLDTGAIKADFEVRASGIDFTSSFIRKAYDFIVTDVKASKSLGPFSMLVKLDQSHRIHGEISLSEPLKMRLESVFNPPNQFKPPAVFLQLPLFGNARISAGVDLSARHDHRNASPLDAHSISFPEEIAVAAQWRQRGVVLDASTNLKLPSLGKREFTSNAAASIRLHDTFFGTVGVTAKTPRSMHELVAWCQDAVDFLILPERMSKHPEKSSSSDALVSKTTAPASRANTFLFSTSPEAAEGLAAVDGKGVPESSLKAQAFAASTIPADWSVWADKTCATPLGKVQLSGICSAREGRREYTFGSMFQFDRFPWRKGNLNRSKNNSLSATNGANLNAHEGAEADASVGHSGLGPILRTRCSWRWGTLWSGLVAAGRIRGTGIELTGEADLARGSMMDIIASRRIGLRFSFCSDPAQLVSKSPQTISEAPPIPTKPDSADSVRAGTSLSDPLEGEASMVKRSFPPTYGDDQLGPGILKRYGQKNFVNQVRNLIQQLGTRF